MCFKDIDIKKAVSYAGTILMIASLFFVFRRIVQMQNDIDFSVLSNLWIFIPLLLVVLGESITVILASINYRSLVTGISGVSVESHTGIKIYNIANMYKYIPGGAMYVIGRNRMAIETEGLRHGKVALATLIEGILWVVAAVILSSVYAFDHFLYYVGQLDILPIVSLIIVLTALMAVPVMYCFRSRLEKILNSIKNDTNGLLAMVLVKRLAFMLVIVSLWGFSFLATLVILGQPMAPALGITIVGLYILSWLVGFLTPGAPSGIGIREFILLMFLGGILNEDILLSAIIVHRALQIAGDILAYVTALGYAHLKNKKGSFILY